MLVQMSGFMFLLVCSEPFLGNCVYIVVSVLCYSG